MDNYKKLTERFQQLHHYGHLLSIAGWDQATMMPAKGNDARANAMAELGGLCHRLATAEEVGDWLAAAEQETLDNEQQANLREIKRDIENARALPESLVLAKTKAGSKCEHAWRTQRQENDWAGFADNLKEVVKLSREEAQLRAEKTGLSPYDALMDLYEPGMRSAEVDRLFDDLRSWLPDLIQTVQDAQKSRPVVEPQGPFSVEQQKQLGKHAMELMGFDFEAGRLDVSSHPFCGGVPEDVRLTTRYNTDSFAESLMGVIHETGHARYEQNLPKAWLGQPVSEARSMGIHESQSLFFEMQIGRSRSLLKHLAPQIALTFGEQDAFTPDNLYQYYTRVEPGFIRVDADEVTYPAHVMLRYEIEKALVEGEIEVDDIPDLWQQKMQSYLGIDTAGNFKDGCMQDIHWTDGSFGYFPSYTLGAMYAAQWFHCIQQQISDMEAQIEAGDLSQISQWLSDSIWQKASFLTTPELVQAASGEALNPQYFRQHLENRYLHQVR
ncbi:carboxypeptidase M32 [Oceanospirillum sediminis]|uniref:Metal-dependent carboxypeptidase n=1 Tax=Oceanospirillum sediminis TaxID=2760088 RepID=A0A839IPL9_9GAMM|nr:carboxypeptidase M32 [Oceanospirillum sediminis]MBB1486397.1 carboxypeptidase M32 [Oceanospirillum sediminis]